MYNKYLCSQHRIILTIAKDGSRLQLKHSAFLIVMRIYILADDPEPRE